MSFNSMLIHQNIENKETLEQLKKDIKSLHEKLDTIISILNKDVKGQCDKMGEHIDFIENVYDNVKNPLGFLCNKINTLTGRKHYSLEYHNSDFESDEEIESSVEI